MTEKLVNIYNRMVEEIESNFFNEHPEDKMPYMWGYLDSLMHNKVITYDEFTELHREIWPIIENTFK